MTSDKLFGLSMILYLITFLFYLIYLVSRNKSVAGKLGYVATGFAWFSLCVHTIAFILRWVESYRLGIGRIPLTNMYESMVFFAWSIMAIYLILEYRYGFRAVGVAASLLSALGLGIISLFKLPQQIEPLVPALQSNWLTAHVITCFLGYAAFAIGFGVSALFFLKKLIHKAGFENDFLPPERLLDELNYKTIAIGFPMLTIGIFTGAVWADYAWGTYWSWDPKETWSLITWFVYALFLHFRLTRGWRGTKSALLSIIGFFFVIFTYWGVNYLLSGLHSYA
ncbi:c-type cytochrome biogenesis protein CcsB [candidate division CSSED10-310 bacterium]|uniref:C-type cytochrome biogenesis protein CcsB n=1 Tax=candidate division CSSED10-310 bacterium TaxID=2855610 RepID=A0ABV6YWM0_UNCC1